jgi:hypothetical protein
VFGFRKNVTRFGWNLLAGCKSRIRLSRLPRLPKADFIGLAVYSVKVYFVYFNRANLWGILLKRRVGMSKPILGRIPKGDRGPKLQFELDGKPCDAYQGETIAAALFAAGRRTFRLSTIGQEPRSFYCGMGVCFECAVTVNGVSNVRACMTPVQEGMKVITGVAAHGPMEDSRDQGSSDGKGIRRDEKV